MIEATSEQIRYQTKIMSGVHSVLSDTTSDKGGSESGFRPHDLLEAALASCMNMTLRMYADQQSLALSGITTRVKLDRSQPEETIFEYKIELQGELSEQPCASARCSSEVPSSPHALETHRIPDTMN